MGRHTDELWASYKKRDSFPSPEEHANACEADLQEFLATHPEVVEDHNLSPLDVFINLAGWGGIIGLEILMIWFVLR